ncbi:hypothetical protein AcW1_000371 [Taiwanofungus camphoratus]|nr:hypothetical protein AcW2_001132 [Antrodia cinnamomea]KAI0936027.1 hypothetical protein AcV5_004273 [Antrodia cinnamomea]KAI0961237.1 hypothetical protein AcV7_000391 [Antrodia cinnamomea]KAI0963241.1 hypothetical protein AcW1_000371 [Antrodia cinnamomea]
MAYNSRRRARVSRHITRPPISDVPDSRPPAQSGHILWLSRPRTLINGLAAHNPRQATPPTPSSIKGHTHARQAHGPWQPRLPHPLDAHSRTQCCLTVFLG